VTNESAVVVVAGLGEIGKPLFNIVASRYDVIGVDIAQCERIEKAEILHICYPYQIEDFIGETARYIDLFRPALTIINSTVAVGTTRAIAERTGVAVVNSPIRGKHARMVEEMLLYTKFVGAFNQVVGAQAARHFQSLGMRTTMLSSPEATELAKLLETTYFGVLLAWAQEA
jgi:UDP-N-acetyl-D-mannosaminuronate dehydrogenase